MSSNFDKSLDQDKVEEERKDQTKKRRTLLICLIILIIMMLPSMLAFLDIF